MSEIKSTKYLALSIGPIYPTIQQARKTRELWVTSFLFSKLMELLIEQLKKDLEILSPLHNQTSNLLIYGAGIYPDRLYARANNINKDKLENAKNAAIEKLTELLLPNFLHSEKADAIEFWKSYIRIVHVFKEIDPEKENVLFTLNEYLDTQELNPIFFEVEPKKNYLETLLKNPYDTKLKTFIDNKKRGAYQGLMSDKGLFPSTADIATVELFQRNMAAYNKLREEAIKAKKEETTEKEKDNEDNLEDFYIQLFQSNISELSLIAQDYHKYFCIVYVDGDSFGDVIEAFKEDTAIKKFSTQLSNFASESARIINNYGGKPVYIGGDDLVFFAPVRSKNGTIFKLIQDLDKEFRNKDKYQFSPQPSLSFGLTISYYKFPLFEANSLSHKQLVSRAKKFKRADGRKKDAIAFRLLKHSGSYFEGIIGREDLNHISGFNLTNEAIPETLLSSVMYKLNALEGVISSIVNSKKLTKERLDYFFNNYFNEPIHQQAEKQLETVKIIMYQLLSKEYFIDDLSINRQENLYSILRVLDFITAKPKSYEPVKG